MKKLLLALFAMAGISAAQAQSSVTIYGILDVGYVGSNQQLTSTAGSAKTKTQISQFGQNAETTSRLGFRGNEDLGGGTNAFFTVEMQLTPQDSNLTGANSSSAVTNRQSFVGLAQKGYGKFALGRQYTPIFAAAAKTSPGQFNNIVGDVIYLGSGSGAAGTTASTTLTGQENGIGFTNRQSNALTVATDQFRGLSANAMYSLKNEDTTQTGATTGGNTNSNAYGIGVDYTFKKLFVNVAYQSVKHESTSGTTVIDVSSGNMTNATDNQYFVGTTYDFGILKAYAQYVNRKITSAINSSEFAQRSAQQVGVRGYVTPKIESWASVGNGRFDQYASTTGSVNFTGYQLGSNYWLSKRTNLYGIFGSTQSSGNPQTTAGAGSSKNMYAVGMRHTF